MSELAPVIPYGPESVLLQFAAGADDRALCRSRALTAFLDAATPDGGEWVPGFHRVLLRSRDGLAEWTRAVSTFLSGLQDTEVPPGRSVVLPVVYDGPDLGAVASHAGLEPREVVARHSGGVYPVHCLGFAPGFPYLGGLDPRLHAPRRTVPRPRVPAGSVAIGGEHTGVYTVPSPGGWNLIGRCRLPLFDPRATGPGEMFRVRAGDVVRFEEVAGAVPPGSAGLPDGDDLADPEARPARIRILSPGQGMSLQDGGRPGYARFGVAPGGAMDPNAAAWANRLVGNRAGAAVLELCLQGQDLLCLADGWLALAGGARIDGVGDSQAFRVRSGDRLRVVGGASGIWSYLAVPGGWAGRPWLGSLSAHSRAGIGWWGRAGLELADASGGMESISPSVAGRRIPWPEIRDFARPPALRLWPGPQWTSFPESDRERFLAAEWEVTSQSDRVGYRLAGPALGADTGQILSEPVLPGSVQIPAGGQPIVTLADGPTLGGYPKIGRIDPEDLPWLVQCRPGQRIRFRWVDSGTLP